MNRAEERNGGGESIEWRVTREGGIKYSHVNYL